jgi:hypothetical protein
LFPQCSHHGDAWAAGSLSRETALDALEAVREALSIPHAATVGDDEIRTKILLERVGHTVVMLDSILRGEHPAPDAVWSIGYLRARLAEHPATGYKTWDERMAELEASKAQGGVR